MIVILSFGSVLIAYVYLVSTAFKDTITATKCIAPVLVLVGNVIPLAVVGIMLAIVANTSSSSEQEYMIFMFSVLYCTNPFCTFLVNAYTIVSYHMQLEYYERKKE